MKKKLFALFLSFAMLVNMTPLFGTVAMAAEDMSCEHHPVHTAECGYVEAVEAHDCGHICDESCQTTVLACVHTEHDETCGYKPAVAEIPEVPCNFAHSVELCGENEETCPHTEHDESCGYAPAVPGTAEVPCVHEHTEDCYVTVCGHQHDEACGYAEAVEGSPCTFVCPECNDRTELGDVDHIRAKLIERLYGSVGGWVVCDFDSYTTTEGRHEGIDFACAPETPIYAVVSGEIIAVSEGDETEPTSRIAVYNNDYDRTVFYFHADPMDTLTVGMWVEAGDLLGYEANRGSSDYHTHLELIPGRSELASISVNDDVLDNENPYPLWDEMLAEPSFYEQLTVAETLDALQEVLNNADVSMLLSLTEAQVDEVEKKAAAFDETDPDEEVFENILETLNAIRTENGYAECTCGQYPHTPECPKFETEDAGTYASGDLYINGNKMTDGQTLTDGAGGTATYSGDVLTLNNFHISELASPIETDAGIYSLVVVYNKSLKIVVNGDNSFKADGNATAYSHKARTICCIYADAPLEITGSGTLTLESAPCDGTLQTDGKTYGNGNSSGLYASENAPITITDTHLIVTGKRARQFSRGMDIHSSLTISGDAIVEATSGNTFGTSGPAYEKNGQNTMGIVISYGTGNTFAVTDNAKLIVKAGNSEAGGSSVGISATDGLTISGSTYLDVQAGSAEVKSYALNAPNGTLKVEGLAIAFLQGGDSDDSKAMHSGNGIVNETISSAVFAGVDQESSSKVESKDETNAEILGGNEYISIEPETYPIWVQGIQVHRDNRDDVLGDGSKKVWYDPIDNILYLTDYQYTGRGYVDTNNFRHPDEYGTLSQVSVEAAIMTGQEGLTIHATGDNHVHLADNDAVNGGTYYLCGLAAYASTKITGSYLEVCCDAKTTPDNSYTFGILAGNRAYRGNPADTLEIAMDANGKLIAHGGTGENTLNTASSSGGICGSGDLVISSGIVEANGYHSGRNTYGIEREAGNITISGNASVSAFAGEAELDSMGLRTANVGGEGSITINTTGTVNVTASKADRSSYGIDSCKDVTITNSIVTALADQVGANYGTGICATGALESDSSVLFTNSVAAGTEIWEDTILYRDADRSTDYYGELRDGNGTVNLTRSHSIDSNDALIIQENETLNLEAATISNDGRIYVNYTGMLNGTQNGTVYYEIVSDITKTSDTTQKATLTYTGEAAGDVTKFTPYEVYETESLEAAARDYGLAEKTITADVTVGALSFEISIWKNGADTPTGVMGTDVTGNVGEKTFTIAPEMAQPVKLIGTVYEFFDLTITKSGVEPLDADMVFVFHIEGSEGLEMDVRIKGNGSVTVKDLPYDTYTITEIESWSWRYQVASTSGFNDDGKADYDHTKVAFVNKCKNDQWLDSNSNAENIFKEENGSHTIVKK